MGVQENSGYCVNCKNNVLIRAKTPNHVLHLILSIVTSGLWIIIWVILSIRAKEWYCSQCGQKISSSFGDKNGIVGSHNKIIKECVHCGAKNRSEDYTCMRCGKALL